MTEKEEIDAILDVFTTDGWKLIVKDIENHYDAINKAYGINSEKELNTIQGELLKLNWFLNFPEWYTAIRDNLDADV